MSSDYRCVFYHSDHALNERMEEKAKRLKKKGISRSKMLLMDYKKGLESEDTTD